MSHLIKLTQFSGIASLLEISRSLEKGRLFGLISDVTELLVCPSDVKLWCDVNLSMQTMADMWDMSFVTFPCISYFSC